MGILHYWGLSRLRMRWVAIGGLALVCLLWFSFAHPAPTHAENDRVITIYHDGIEQTVVTDASTIADALKRGGVNLGKYDAVEPSRDTQLVAPSYDVNVYRARPVTVVDGNNRHEIMSPHTSARQIAADAGVKLYDEDTYDLTRIDDFVTDGGVGLKMTIHRALPVTLNLYSKMLSVRTQSKTVGDLLHEKGIVLDVRDGTNPSASSPIAAGMTVQVYRDGVQTMTVEEGIAFPVRQIGDADRPVGYKAVQTPGILGAKQVTYEVTMKGGVEAGRTPIQSVVTRQPVTQVEVVGVKPGAGGLSQSKGVNFFTDSKGVTHRETYYDLSMNGVMKFCNGTYSIRTDGVKVDQDGYVLVAADLSRYPRCSIVETSLGLGKVYDTGAFISVYPDGFDLATDWSNHDGR